MNLGKHKDTKAQRNREEDKKDKRIESSDKR